MTASADPSDPVVLLAAMRQLQAALDQADAEAARQLGLARSDWKCLMLLAGGPLGPRVLGERLGLASGSMTALIDRLAGRGFVVRVPDASDRRALLVAPTALAMARLQAIEAPVREALARLAARYPAGYAASAAKQMSDAARITDWATAQVAKGGAG